jgi:molybdopterin-guanine dinucleotide biosynthesis protein A
MGLTGIILAGGRSTRMGRDKALLPMGQQTLIEVVIQRLRPCVERLMVIGGAHNAAHLRDLPVEAVVTDVKPGWGPLMGIYTGLMSTETPLNLLLPCDMPWVEGRLIERLVETCHGEVEVVASRHPVNGMQPFPLVCHARACRMIGALLDRGARSLEALLQERRARLVTIDEPGLWRAFTNVNTLADYAKLAEAAVAR